MLNHCAKKTRFSIHDNVIMYFNYPILGLTLLTFPIYLNYSPTLTINCSRISHNVTHVLKPLLPTQTQHSYNLRDRRHNFVLIEKHSQINHRHFIIIRQLYKYVCAFLLCPVLSCFMSTFIKRILYCIEI